MAPERRVAVLVVRERAECLGHVVFVDARLARGVEHLEPIEHDVALGEGARLVETDDVDPGQALDRGQLLHEHVAAGERDRGDPEREARQQHQALGDHAHDAGDDADQRLLHVVARELAPQQQRRHGEEGVLDVAQKGVDAVDELGADEREPPGLGRELAGVGLGADLGRLEPARARDDEAAREHLRPRRLVDRVRLSGEQRLVDLEAVADRTIAVGRHLVAGAQLDEVVEHHVLDRDLEHVLPSRTTRARGALSTAS